MYIYLCLRNLLLIIGPFIFNEYLIGGQFLGSASLLVKGSVVYVVAE